MDGLKAQLYSDGLDLIQGRKKIEYIVGQAVRPGADGKGHDIRVYDGLGENFPEIVHRSISVGISLEVSHKMLRRKLRPELFFLGFDLFSDGKAAAAKSPLPPALQKIQPPLPTVPSRLGQVMPPFKETLYIFSPYCFFHS